MHVQDAFLWLPKALQIRWFYNHNWSHVTLILSSSLLSLFFVFRWGRRKMHLPAVAMAMRPQRMAIVKHFMLIFIHRPISSLTAPCLSVAPCKCVYVHNYQIIVLLRRSFFFLSRFDICFVVLLIWCYFCCWKQIVCRLDRMCHTPQCWMTATE